MKDRDDVREIVTEMLEQSIINLHLDPRVEGVLLPKRFQALPRLVLQIGRNMPIPIPDLKIESDRITCTLSFNRTPFFCVIPWECIFGVTDMNGKGFIREMEPIPNNLLN